MFSPSVRKTRGRQAWIRAVIFVGLYSVLLLSFTQCALVLYLYGTSQVDGFMTPSLIIGLISSFLSVPFVVIHTILSWQYRRVPGLNMPRNALHMACSHLPRIMVAMWLAAAVAGLVVVSKQPTCIVATQIPQYWKAGMSCQIHRSAVILSILAFLTTSALFFCFQICERPYDASLFGLYAPQRPPRDGSILSDASWESETLKNEILYLCRHPDAGPGNGELYWSPNDSSLFEAPVRPPSIRYPGPTRVRPQLHLNTHTNSIRPSIATSLTDTSPNGSSVDETAGSIAFRSDNDPASRNQSLTSTLQPGTEALLTMPPVPKIPDIPELLTKMSKHTRQKSSVSSRKFLPKDWLSEPLSEDPQIRALASPPLIPEYEPIQPTNQGEKEITESDKSGILIPNLPSPPAPAALKTGNDSDASQLGPINAVQTRRRSRTVPGNQPPVLPPGPLTVRKSRTSYINPARSIHHPHHPNRIPASITPKSSTDGLNRQNSNQRSQMPRNTNNVDNKRPLQRHRSTTARLPPRGQNTTIGHYPPFPRFPPPQQPIIKKSPIKDSNTQSLHQQQRPHVTTSFPRNAQPPRHPPQHHTPRQPPYTKQHAYPTLPPPSLSQHHHPTPNQPPRRPSHTRRFHSNDGRGFDPARTLPPIPRSDETATLYPSTRRPRSSTYGGVSSVAMSQILLNNNQHDPKDMNSMTRRTSLTLAEGGMALEGDREIIDKKNMYRGAERTSICGAPAGLALSS